MELKKQRKSMPIIFIEEGINENETNENEKTIIKTKYDCFWEQHGDGKPSQTERYEKHNSPIGILKFIRIGGGPKWELHLKTMLDLNSLA